MHFSAFSVYNRERREVKMWVSFFALLLCVCACLCARREVAGDLLEELNNGHQWA